jgi:hypothetical protein
VLTLLPRNFQNNFAALVVSCVALRLGLPMASQATLLQSDSLYIKATLQQRLGFFTLKNPSNANVKREQSEHE